jgi:hypothetical protein
MNEKLYKPKSNIRFKQKFALLYDANARTSISTFFFILIGINGALVYYCGKKVYNFK